MLARSELQMCSVSVAETSSGDRSCAAEGTMAHCPADPIVLSAADREELEGFVRAHSTPQQVALRARIILSAADGIPNRQSARRLGITVHTVRCWRQRWDDEPALALADRLADAPRPGTPPRWVTTGARATLRPSWKGSWTAPATMSNGSSWPTT